MKCLVCEKFSWKVVCSTCLEQIPLTPRQRILKENVKIYSFYRYSDVAYLMRSKYHLVGSRILKILAQKAAHYFFTHLQMPFVAEAMALDDYPYIFYSHTGVILKEFARKSQGKLKPIFGSLKAQNQVKYAGETLLFRQSHPKRFYYDGKPRTLILLDDIITTGTSFNEALEIVRVYQSQVLFCLALCDAQE